MATRSQELSYFISQTSDNKTIREVDGIDEEPGAELADEVIKFCTR